MTKLEEITIKLDELHHMIHSIKITISDIMLYDCSIVAVMMFLLIIDSTSIFFWVSVGLVLFTTFIGMAYYKRYKQLTQELIKTLRIAAEIKEDEENDRDKKTN